MIERRITVTASDALLLRSIARAGNVVAAARAAGMSRDRATYRLRRLSAAFGGPVVAGRRGGRGHGISRLTALGLRALRTGFDALELARRSPADAPGPANVLRGVYHRGPPATVSFAAGGPVLRVTVSAVDGAPVDLHLDPEAILLARRRFRTSARNVFPALVLGPARPGPDNTAVVRLRAGALRLRAVVTPETVDELHLSTGARVFVFVKATALRAVAVPAR